MFTSVWDGANDNIDGLELESTKGRTKNQLYKTVEEKYLIPAWTSKGVTREYLLRVLRDEFFRVEKRTISKFECDLTAKQLKHSGSQSCAFIVKKLNILLAEEGKKPLGFTEFDLPEQNWLYRIARYIDKENILELFEEPVTPLSESFFASKRRSFQIFEGRMFAYEHFFQKNQELKSNKKFWEALRQISATYKDLAATQMNLEVLNHEVGQVRSRIAVITSNLEDQLSKAATTKVCLTNPSVKSEDILSANGATLTDEVRTELRNSRNFIKYIYCTDNLMDLQTAEVNNITGEALKLKHENKRASMGKTEARQPLNPRPSVPEQQNPITRQESRQMNPTPRMDIEKRG